jgi:hypothetical protein
VLPEQEDGALEEAGLDLLAPPGLLPSMQRRQRPDDPVRRRRDVDHRRASPERLAGRPGHVRQPAHHLGQLVE